MTLRAAASRWHRCQGRVLCRHYQAGRSQRRPYQLSWTPATAGTFALTAVAVDNGGVSTTSAAVSAGRSGSYPPVSAGGEAVSNAGFEADNAPVSAPAGWQTTTGWGTNANADYTEAYPGAHGGLYHGTHYRPEAYEVYTYQVIRNLPNGTYTLSAWMKSSGGQSQAQLQAKNFGGNALAADAPATPDGQWVLVTIPGIRVSNGQCEIGFYSRASGGRWLYFDDVALVPQDGKLQRRAYPGFGRWAFTLYPNPADDQVTLSASFARKDVVIISILNAQGNLSAQHWRDATPGNNQFVIPTRYLPDGLYTLKFSSKSQSSSFLRLQVQH
ncbi:MAG: T9SS type A sorting domain-containing protein [Hymenobacter sp.]